MVKGIYPQKNIGTFARCAHPGAYGNRRAIAMDAPLEAMRQRIGLSWHFTTLLILPLPSSLWNGACVTYVLPRDEPGPDNLRFKTPLRAAT